MTDSEYKAQKRAYNDSLRGRDVRDRSDARKAREKFWNSPQGKAARAKYEKENDAPAP